MTAYTDLRVAIKDTLDNIPSIGMTHNRERFASDPSTYLDMFNTTIGITSQIRAWLILRESVTPDRDTLFGEDTRVHNFVLRGYMGFNDANDSYGTFQALCDTVVATFDDQTTLSVSGVEVRGVGPCSLRSFETGQFGSILAHMAVIAVPVTVAHAVGVA